MKNRFAVITTLILMISGCATLDRASSVFDYKQGTRIEDLQLARLVNGETLESEVYLLFGEPDKRIQRSRGALWRYTYATTPALPFSPRKVEIEHVLFEFNSQGVLSRHRKIVGRSDNVLYFD